MTIQFVLFLSNDLTFGDIFIKLPNSRWWVKKMAVICSILQLSEIQNKEINKNESQSCSFQHSLNIWDYHWG